jgi:hypothetical protein
MRDPRAYTIKGEASIERYFYSEIKVDDPLNRPILIRLKDSNKIPEFHVKNNSVSSRLITFVTYPQEWCNAQFRDAAQLTLDISREILGSGLELKDATAWNVVFEYSTPKFVDFGSYQNIVQKQWVAFGQFLRQFIFPLALSRRLDVPANFFHKINRDGVTPSQFISFYGKKAYFSKYLPLIFGGLAFGGKKKPKVSSIKNKESNHNGLYELLALYIPTISRVTSDWADYVSQRAHYEQEEVDRKRSIFKCWISEYHITGMIDLGCNTGEFSLIAAEQNISVIAIDSDHECVERLYLASSNLKISCVHVDINDLPGGRGWGGAEFDGLMDRLCKSKVDLCLAFALIHHIVIAGSIPFLQFASFLNKITTKYLAIELIANDDPMVELVAHRFSFDTSSFTIEAQENHLNEFFTTLNTTRISKTRVLYLMKKNDL